MPDTQSATHSARRLRPAAGALLAALASLPLAMLPVGTAAEMDAALGEVLKMVSDGELTMGEGEAIAKLIEAKRRAYENSEIVRRLDELEANI